MEIDITKLADHFARTPFLVEGIYYCSWEPGIQHTESTQPFPGFIFPLSGNAEFHFNGVLYDSNPSNIVHGGPDMDIGWRVVGNRNWEYILVLYRICGAEPEGFSLLTSHFQLATGESLRMVELLQRLWRVSSQPGGISAFQAETLFRDVLEEMFICVRNQINDGCQGLFERAATYIHEHYMDNFTVPRLAEQHGVNRNRLAYVFNKYAGMGPRDYLIQYRLNRAKELLWTNKAPISEIGRAVGITDPFYFSRIFKKKFGISPTEFRDGFINNPY